MEKNKRIMDQPSPTLNKEHQVQLENRSKSDDGTTFNELLEGAGIFTHVENHVNQFFHSIAETIIGQFSVHDTNLNDPECIAKDAAKFLGLNFKEILSLSDYGSSSGNNECHVKITKLSDQYGKEQCNSCSFSIPSGWRNKIESSSTERDHEVMKGTKKQLHKKYEKKKETEIFCNSSFHQSFKGESIKTLTGSTQKVFLVLSKQCSSGINLSDQKKKKSLSLSHDKVPSIEAHKKNFQVHESELSVAHKIISLQNSPDYAYSQAKKVKCHEILNKNFLVFFNSSHIPDVLKFENMSVFKHSIAHNVSKDDSGLHFTEDVKDYLLLMYMHGLPHTLIRIALASFSDKIAMASLKSTNSKIVLILKIFLASRFKCHDAADLYSCAYLAMMHDNISSAFLYCALAGLSLLKNVIDNCNSNSCLELNISDISSANLQLEGPNNIPQSKRLKDLKDLELTITNYSLKNSVCLYPTRKKLAPCSTSAKNNPHKSSISEVSDSIFKSSNAKNKLEIVSNSDKMHQDSLLKTDGHVSKCTKITTSICTPNVKGTSSKDYYWQFAIDKPTAYKAPVEDVAMIKLISDFKKSSKAIRELSQVESIHLEDKTETLGKSNIKTTHGKKRKLKGGQTVEKYLCQTKDSLDSQKIPKLCIKRKLKKQKIEAKEKLVSDKISKLDSKTTFTQTFNEKKNVRQTASISSNQLNSKSFKIRVSIPLSKLGKNFCARRSWLCKKPCMNRKNPESKQFYTTKKATTTSTVSKQIKLKITNKSKRKTTMKNGFLTKEKRKKKHKDDNKTHKKKSKLNKVSKQKSNTILQSKCKKINKSHSKKRKITKK